MIVESSLKWYNTYALFLNLWWQMIGSWLLKQVTFDLYII